MDAVGVQAPDRHDSLDLGDADLAARRGGLIEVARPLAEHQVAAFVRLPSLYDRQTGADSELEHITLPVEVLDPLARRDLGAHAGPGVEARDARAARAHPL